MTRIRRLSWFFAGWLGLAVLPAPAADKPSEAEQTRFFEQNVRPLLAEKCWKCHGEEKQRGGLRLDSLAAALKGGESGPAVVPGRPDESLLVEAINYASFEMPPDGKLSDEEIAALTMWIQRGAFWPNAALQPRHTGPAEPKITDADREHWAFQPVRRPEVPTVDDGGWCRNEIDQFIFQQLSAAGLTPAPEADRRTLLRRVSFDVTGLPPSPEEIEAFLQDDSPQAYEHLVDRLLDSPRYGERWAQHWLDLVRYAESDGFRQDAFRPHAWRYRDYVIRAFNEDKPYDRFVREQLAGDEIAPDDADALVATGFLRHYLYEYNQRDARTQWQDILNNVTDVTGEVFLGLGMGCARCHDHKFDPILQDDYYGLQAFFATMLPRDDVPAASGAERAAYRQQLAVWEERTADIRQQIEEIVRPYRQKAARAAIEKFPKDIQAIMAIPQVERTTLERQLADLVNRQIEFEEERAQYKDADRQKLEALRKQLAEFDSLKPAPLPPAMTVSDTGAPASPMIIPGDRKQRPISPGFLSVMHTEPVEIVPPSAAPQSTGRRATLAAWIADPSNPLTTRVIVNRVWQYHFGRGIVETASDFGRLGDVPSHPELLDWLTDWFVRNGESFKRLHRLILTSAVYRQSAAHPDELRQIKLDPHNCLRWRFDVRRLDAEQFRDAALAVSGQLDLKTGGPSVDASQPRRSIYTRHVRNQPDPLLKAFDLADGFNSVAQRNVTTTSTQALLMINGPWLLERARALASAVTTTARAAEPSADPLPPWVNAAYRRCYGRDPLPAELAMGVAYLQQQAAQLQRRDSARLPVTAGIRGREGQAAALRPDSPQEVLAAAHSDDFPSGDFTLEAVIVLDSLYPDAAVRTIVSQWDNDTKHAGWAFGVTSKQSKYQPRNLILQMVGDAGYEVISSDLRPELNKPYYVAVSVRAQDKTADGVRFWMKDLSQPDAPLQTARAAHFVTGEYRGNWNVVVGGRHGQTRHKWDGLIDDVRISAAALTEKELLIHGGRPSAVVAHWMFEEQPGFFTDASGRGHHLGVPEAESVEADARAAALVDLCHVLLNSNEFLYVD